MKIISSKTYSIKLLVMTGLTCAAGASVKVPAYHLTQKINLAGDTGWDYLTMDSVGRRLYVSRSTHVTVINVDTGAVVGDISDTPGVHGIAVDHKTGSGFTSNGRNDSVTIFSLKTLRKINQVKVGRGPDAIIFDPGSRRIFTFNDQGKSATALDPATGHVIGTVVLPGRPEFAASDATGHIYDNIEDKNEVAVINARTLKIEHIWPISPGEEASGLAVDIRSHRLFSVCGNGLMIVLNTLTGMVVAKPAIGDGPDACAFDAALRLAFSPNGRDGTLDIIRQDSANRYQKVATITTQSGARTMALDERSHRVFVIAGTPVPAPAGKPGQMRRTRRYVSGSVAVFVYSP